MNRALPSRRPAGRAVRRGGERGGGGRRERRFAARRRPAGRSLAQRARLPLRQQGRPADGLRDRRIPAAGRVGPRGGGRVGGRRCRRRASRHRPGLRPVRGRAPGALRGHVPPGRPGPRQRRVHRRERGGLRAPHRDRGALPRGRSPARAFHRSGRGQRVVAGARPLGAVDQRAPVGAHRRAGSAPAGRRRVGPVRRGGPPAARAGRRRLRLSPGGVGADRRAERRGRGCRRRSRRP